MPFVTNTFLFVEGATVGFLDTFYNVNENEELATVFITVLSGELSVDVLLRLTTQDGSAKGYFLFLPQ